MFILLSCPLSSLTIPGKPALEVSASALALGSFALGSQGWVMRRTPPPTNTRAATRANASVRRRSACSRSTLGLPGTGADGMALSMRTMACVSSVECDSSSSGDSGSSSPWSVASSGSSPSIARACGCRTISCPAGLGAGNPQLGQVSASSGMRDPQLLHHLPSSLGMTTVRPRSARQAGQRSESSGTFALQLGQITGVLLRMLSG